MVDAKVAAVLSFDLGVARGEGVVLQAREAMVWGAQYFHRLACRK